MGTILLLTNGTEGDVRPFLQLGSALKQGGHAVTLLTHCAYAERARQAGLDFAAIDTPDEYERELDDTHLINNPQGLKTFVQRHMLPKIARICDLVRTHHRPGETVLFGHYVALLNAQIAAEYLHLPLGLLFIAPSQIAIIPFLEQVIESTVGGQINQIRAQLGLPAIQDWAAWLRVPKPSVGQWPEWFGPREPGWPWDVTPIGWLLFAGSEPATVPEEVEALIDPKARPILITGGTGSFVEQDFYAAGIAACEQIGRPGILVARRRKFLPERLPNTISWFPALPFATVMPHMAAVIHHGGMGTSGQSVAAGVPQVVLAIGADRPDNGGRLQALGVAECLLRTQWRGDRVAAALERLIHSPSVGERCRELARWCQNSDPTTAACQTIEQLLQSAAPFGIPAAVFAAPGNAHTEQAALPQPDPAPRDARKRADALTPERRLLLARLLQQQEAQQRRQQRVSRVHRQHSEQSFPLSFAQQRLWLHEQILPDSTAYNVSFAYRFSGQLDPLALEHGLKGMIQRHEILRTHFGMRDGEPIQIIAADAPVVIQQADLSNYSPAERAARLEQLVAEQARRPFDLAHDALLRIGVVRLGATEHLLLLVVHHIVCDGWSGGIFIRELIALYNAAANGIPAELPALPIQYIDYAVWQRARLQTAAMQAHQAYWQQQLANLPPVLELPVARSRPVSPTFNGASEAVHISDRLGQGLKALAQAERVTLFMLLLAAFKCLLHRYSGSADVVVGTPIAGRNRMEFEPLIGCFVNMLVLRTDFAGDPQFRTLLHAVRETTMSAYSHQEFPFEQVVEMLQPARTLNTAPLFQIAFVLHNTPGEAFDLPGLRIQRVDFRIETTQFDLTLHMREIGQSIDGWIEYSTDLFDSATVAAMSSHFQTLLEGIAADPNQRISRLPLLPAAEHRQLLNRWNAAPPQTAGWPSLHERFAEQAALTPDAIAVVLESQNLTYGELNRRADQLARHLIGLGAGPGALVGMCVDRSLELVVGLLGVLKAGAAYVPIDTGYPPERIGFMLADARAPVLLTQQSMIERLPAYAGHVICLDTDWTTIAAQAPQTCQRHIAPEAPAYVIYTSGSTGRPKGVVVSHANATRLFQATQDWFHFGAGDVWTLFHSYAFDFSVWEIWGALCYGGRLVVVPYLTSRSATEFWALVQREQVTVLNQTPAAFQQFIRADANQEAVLALRYVIFGGEALDLRSLQPWFERHGDQQPQLVNMYGITETTVHVTYRPIGLADLAAEARSVIGQPIPDLQLYILDRHGALVPTGLPGELYVGGAGLAQGYLARPELTAERFIPNPFATTTDDRRPTTDLRDKVTRRQGDKVTEERETITPSPLHPFTVSEESKVSGPWSVVGGRLYRTGDLVRYLPGGDMEYLGRIDQQVKIRGFRIELGEITAALESYPALREAVVIALPDEQGQTRLVAYAVPAPGAVASAGDLRTHLARTLPPYMLPAAFVFLDSLPLTSNGKLDRRALPPPDAARPTLRGAFVAPRNPLELQLAQIWEDVLQVRPVGVTDNFFDLGGHSLLAVKLMAQIEQHMGHDLPIAMLFQGPTIEELAGILQQGRSVVPYTPLVTLQPQGDRRPLFVIHPVGGNVMCYISLTRCLGADQPCYGLQSPGLDDHSAPFHSIEEMAARYVEAIRGVQPAGPYYLGGWCFGGSVAVEVAHQLQIQGHEIALLTLIDTYAPFPGAALPDIDYATLVSWFARDMAVHYGKELLIAPEELRGREHEAQLQIVRERMQRHDILPAQTGLDQLRRYLHVYTSNAQALGRYTPPRYTGQITLLRATEEAPADNPTLGWSHYATQPLAVYDVPGNHNTMVFPPHVIVLAEQLRACLDAAEMHVAAETQLMVQVGGI